MVITNLQAIQGLGNLITWYQSDLNYISLFKKYKNSDIGDKEYLDNNKGFQKFINEYKVARNVKKARVSDCMKFTKEYILKNTSFSIDNLAIALKEKEITQDGKIMTSLASKLLFLNNPVNVIIIDTLNRRAVNEKTNNYNNFKQKVKKFQQKNINIIQKYLTTADVLLKEIENNYQDLEIDFEQYRKMRYTDKILWTIGR